MDNLELLNNLRILILIVLFVLIIKELKGKPPKK